MKLKNEIRQLYRKKRLDLDPQERELLSAKIAENAFRYLLNKDKVKHMHIFLPIERLQEVNTLPLIKGLQEMGKEIYTSVADFSTGEMKTVKLAVDQQIKAGKYGIPIPTEIMEGRDALLQLVFIPLLAYDLNGHRLGYGKGFYDKFLTKLNHKVLKVGLSYFPAERQVPFEIHDVHLDACINPDEIILF